MKRFVTLMIVLGAVSASGVVVDVTGQGRAKQEVAIRVANAAFAKSLRKNIELSGLFVVKPSASITVSGSPESGVRAEGAGKVVTLQGTNQRGGDAASTGTGDAAARMAARRLSDAMCEAYGHQKGFAQDPIVFLNRTHQKGKTGALVSEICTTYPDGYDIRQLTHDGEAVVGPRWQGPGKIFYTNLKAGPQIWELDAATGRRNLRWSFRGLSTGAAVSPDGTKVAIILSFQGNPELYVIPMGGKTFTRLTTTPNASEGQPAWSPDGREIVYVSDETRGQQLFAIDVATRAKRRLTSQGRANVAPDWGRDGRIVYSSSGVIRVLEPSVGDRGAKAVTQTGGWAHPSWARDGRHIVAASGKVLFVLDSAEDGDGPRPVFSANGNWCDPSWAK